ncbi:VPS15 [Candida theae]|uniref:non-specific serine/threonine protein kinase n=1 Tax=Candida theae TaxID=1198502 RepID=A0AAD5G0B7_9ASCO|nr:VPS15 [Candida theae]KAI5964510.1 VPS15 [Candida theae]
MGQKLSLLAPSAPTIAISSYVDALENYQYVELLSNSRFLKTIKAIDKSTGQFVIIKLLIKPSTPSYTLQLQDVLEYLVKESSVLYPFKSVLTWHKLIETDRAGYMIREMAKINLYDRLSLRPFLEPVEKLFITFQLLKSVCELHSLNVHHGDLRLENILVTSWDWILISDFANITKPTYIPEDNPNQFSFYYDGSGRRVCYLAPERFYNSQNSSSNNNNNTVSNFNDNGSFNFKNNVTDEMDLFSLGCVIAELWCDGEPVFTLSQLFKYMRNEYEPNFSSIPNPHIVKLIQRLLKVNPSERSSARELLQEFRGNCFPEFFYTFLYEFMENVTHQEDFAPKHDKHITSSDLKIDHIYNNFARISESLGFTYKVQQPSSSLLPMKMNLPTMPHNYRIQPKKYVNNEDGSDASLVIINLVTSLLNTVKLPDSKRKCCLLILALSEQINDESKLDRSLPYLCSILDEFVESAVRHSLDHVSAKVVCLALYAITTLMLSCSYVTPINVLVFPEYLLAKVNNLLVLKIDSESQKLINGCVAICLPYLATVAKKFWSMSKALKQRHLGSTATSSNSSNLLPESVMKAVTSIHLSKDQLDQKFKEITLSILTDSHSSVKVSLLENILPLCQFFGRDKTNDIILPHLISYLNDSDPTLRLAFLSAVLQIGPYIGALSFEQYILPLLLQSINECEQFVVLKVLRIFNVFVSQKLINSKLEFNTLEIYTELLSNSIHLLLHPNEWIRQSLINLIISISSNLSDADRYCFLYPLIKGYLSYDVFEINWNTLYPSLTRPLSKQVYDGVMTWALAFTSKSLFWQEKGFSLTPNKGNSTAMSFPQNMGKSVYMPKLSTAVVSYNSGRNKENIPLSSEDKQWLLKLKSIGLDDKSLWKVLVLRSYIYRISRISRNPHQKSQKHKPQQQQQQQQQHIQFEQFNLTPRNVFLDVVFKSEPVTSVAGLKNNKIVVKSEDTVSLRSLDHSRQSHQTLILPNMERAIASVQTIEANVFGEMESSRDTFAKTLWINDPTLFHKSYHVDEDRVITCHVKHTYAGSNHFIWNYLHTLTIAPTLDDFAEFGKAVKGKLQVGLESLNLFNLNIRRTSEEIDAYTCLDMSPMGDYFITGSENGVVKIWGKSKLEDINRLSNASDQSIELKSRVTSIAFCQLRNCVVIACRDGSVRIFRIEFVRNKSRKIVKFMTPVLIRKSVLNSFAILVTILDNMIYAIDYQSQVHAIDMITMKQQYSLQNPLSFGLITSFITSGTNKDSWCIIGTQSGYLTLWDLRFKLLLRSWQVQVEPAVGDDSDDKFVLDQIDEVRLINSSNIDLARAKFGDVALKERSITIYVKSTAKNLEMLFDIPSLECKGVLQMGDSSRFQCKLSEVDSDLSQARIQDMIDELSLEVK